MEDVLTVPNQQAVIPSPRSVLSRDKCLPLDTWNSSEIQGNVFDNPRPMFDSSQTLYQGILHSTTPSAAGAVPVQVSARQPVARGEERFGSTTTMPMPGRRPSTCFPSCQWKFQRIPSLDSKDYTHRSFNLTNSPTPSSLLCRKTRLKNPSKFLFRFSLGCYVIDQRSGHGRFSG